MNETLQCVLGGISVLAFGIFMVWVQARKDRVDRAIRRKYLRRDPLYEGYKDSKERQPSPDTN